QAGADAADWPAGLGIDPVHRRKVRPVATVGGAAVDRPDLAMRPDLDAGAGAPGSSILELGPAAFGRAEGIGQGGGLYGCARHHHGSEGNSEQFWNSHRTAPHFIPGGTDWRNIRNRPTAYRCDAIRKSIC